MLSYTEENYLKAMFNLSGKSGEVTVNDLSKSLDIKMPTVTSMVQKLAGKNLVNYQPYKPLTLTEEGERMALSIIRKHRLTEMFLVEVMGFGWEEVHEVAEQIEHIHSPKFFEKMDEMLNYPTVDPHGSPIPDRGGKIQTRNFRSLHEFEKGDTLEFVAVTDSDDEFLKYLNSKNINLGITFKVTEKEEFDDIMELDFEGEKVILSAKVTSKMLVKEK